jgi:catechol 2,3-dioxygenase-like lactoylglutathione lyase family enzyme
MRRALLLYAGISLCFIALDLRAEEQPLATRVDHVYVESDKAHSLFTFFKDTFQLPEMWPFSDRGTHASGGLWLGNAVLEFASFPHSGDKPVKTEFRGIAFEPSGGADETAAELTKRGISRREVENNMRQGSDGQTRVVWSILHLKDFSPIEADVFFVDYKYRKSVAAKYKAADDELAARNRGPLGIVGAAEITVGVRDLEDARKKWSALLAPSPRISDDAFVFDSGPRIRLIHAESPGIQGIVLKVRRLDQAAKFLEERGLLAKDDSGRIAISPTAIDGLSIRLIDDSQAEESGNPLLGRGRGVDNVGIGVRDLQKTINDYEQVLGFKCTKNSPLGYSGALRSLIFFEDETLLEFLSPPQPASAINSDYLRYLAAFVEKHEGAMSLALETSSAKGAADYLKAHNFEVKLSEWPRIMKEGETKPSPAQYYSVSTPDTPTGNKQIFMLWIWLIEHVSPERPAKIAARREQGMMAHPNTALRIHSVWFAVCDLDASLRNLHDAGFEPGEAREAKLVHVRIFCLQSRKRISSMMMCGYRVD